MGEGEEEEVEEEEKASGGHLPCGNEGSPINH